MKRMLLALSVVAFTAVGANADDPPNFMKQTYPESALQAAWDEYQAVYNPEGAVDGLNKQLIALAVSAQIPCDYCITAHSMKAKSLGATDEQIKEALAVASLVRKWSTTLNGYEDYTIDDFKADIGAPTN
jgi:AhpD family alkylhydroperoxidase